MPRLSADAAPKYRKHKASGQAVVTLSGRDHYLGPYGTSASRKQYDRLVSEWMANGRAAPVAQADMTVIELLAAYKRFAKGYYQGGTEYDNAALSMKPLQELYARLPVRPAPRIDGERMGSRDLKCAQPALLALLIAHLYPQSGLLERTSYMVRPVVAPYLDALPRSPVDGWSARNGAEFAEFCELVCSGQFNCWLRDATKLDLAEAKLGFLRDVLAKKGRYDSDVENAFRLRFPAIHAVIKAINRFNHGNLICLLQRLESWLCIEQVSPRLVGGVPFVNLHDAIYSGEPDVGAVENAFQETFEEIGFSLTVA